MIATVVRRMMLVVGVIVVMPWPGTAAPQSRAENDILDRTANYVKAFVRGFANVVAEERYVQTANPDNPGGGRQRRVLLSDFLLVKGQTGSEWYQFRDVREVDGKPVPDRDRRLTELFLEPWDTAIRQASRIAGESARYNLFHVGSINFPLLALALLQPPYRDRLEFSIGRTERVSGRELRVIMFREPNVPSTVIDGVRSSGRAWVHEATGRVMKTELELKTSVEKSPYSIITTFIIDDRLQLAVPAEMRDSYPGSLGMTGVATYGKFRTFQVRTTEEVRK